MSEYGQDDGHGQYKACAAAAFERGGSFIDIMIENRCGLPLSFYYWR